MRSHGAIEMHGHAARKRENSIGTQGGNEFDREIRDVLDGRDGLRYLRHTGSLDAIDDFHRNRRSTPDRSANYPDDRYFSGIDEPGRSESHKIRNLSQDHHSASEKCS